MGRPTKIFFKETFQRKNGCKRSFLPCLRLCLCDSCNKPTVPTNNEVPTNQVPTNPPNSPNQVPTNATSSWRISRDNEVPTNPPNQVPTNATCSWRISQDNEVPTDPPNQVPTNDTSSWRISQDNEVPTDPPKYPPTTKYPHPPPPPHGGYHKSLCECINPFHGKPNAYRGDPDTLCGPQGPGVCYVDCNADCRDIQPTASASRCKSSLACDIIKGAEWQ